MRNLGLLKSSAKILVVKSSGEFAFNDAALE